jgi:class 3 adenylate cyclase
MQATNSTYNYLDSVDRIGEILNSSDTSYDDSKSIPSRDRLTFLNGFYVYVSVIFIDIRGSKELSNKHTRPVLAKIYRSYISEMVAVLRDNENVNEIYIEGDGVWAVYNTPYKQDLDSVFSTAARAASLKDIQSLISELGWIMASLCILKQAIKVAELMRSSGWARWSAVLQNYALKQIEV